jgi:hypothetical protein
MTGHYTHTSCGLVLREHAPTEGKGYDMEDSFNRLYNLHISCVPSNTLEQSPSWEADFPSAGQGISCLL